MGHTEMLLAVAGLDESEVSKLTSQLASGDWSGLSAGDRTAFAFARKQAAAPSKVTSEDFQQLVDYFGLHRAIDIVWWASRCHYMTRVADAFQLPLERENVFQGPVRPKSQEKK